MTKRKVDVYNNLRAAYDRAYDRYEMGDDTIDEAMRIADEMHRLEDYRNNLDRVED